MAQRIATGIGVRDPGLAGVSRSLGCRGAARVALLDLQDFFVSIPGGRVTALFRTLGYPEQAARVLAGLCTDRVPAEVVEVHDAAKYAFELPQLNWLARKRYRSPMLNPDRGRRLKALFGRIEW